MTAPAPSPYADGPLLTPAPVAPLDATNRGVVDPSLAATAATPSGSVDWVGIAGYSALVALALVLTLIAASTLWWMLYAWRSHGQLRNTRFADIPRGAGHRFTLLVPGRHEEEVMGQTLDRLAQQTHPDFEIIAIVGDDDPGTDAVARAAAERHPDLIRVVVDSSVPKNKPKALNTALKTATGDVVGVFDAEDEVHPELLRLVDDKFQSTDATVVQGGVQLMNFETSWWALRNVMEYYFWFRSRLHFQAATGFIPLGGNTVFVTREALDRTDGWDAECLAEDAELGVRLSSQGDRVVVAYSPEVVTREETPGSLGSLYKQRTRWDQGYLQVLRKGEWRKLPTLTQRLFARYLLSMPFLQAATGLLIPLSIALILFVKVPTAVALLTFIPLAPTIMTIAVEVAGLNEFGRVYGRPVRIRDYARLILGTFPFQIFLALAACRSVWREWRGRTGWEKTEHTGAHREAAGTTAPNAAPAGAFATVGSVR